MGSVAFVRRVSPCGRPLEIRISPVTLRRALEAFLDEHPPHLLKEGRKGLEKESLRIDPDGRLARTPHPYELGSALTHPYVTTDYAEAMLELVTPPFIDPEDATAFLRDLHVLVHRRIGDELLWPASMPCILRPSDVRIARYGSSPQGLLRHVYRIGLGHRYGRLMQTIAGVHFNYSFPEALWTREATDGGEERNRRMMGVLRNVVRVAWFPCYLFGASPAMCRTYRPGHALPSLPWAEDTRYEPLATTLRMSDLGYQNRRQAPVRVDLNSLADYVTTLTDATRTPDPAYERIGVRRHDRWRQLSPAVLQTENEYYAYARPKPRKVPDERPLRTLLRDGIRYLEIRVLDLDPEDPCGVGTPTLRFLELLLWRCFLLPSPPITECEAFDASANVRLVAYQGRSPDLRLATPGGKRRRLADLASEILDDLEMLADVFDGGQSGGPYALAVAEARRRVAEPDTTPSGRFLRTLEDRRLGFSAYVLELARDHALRHREETYSEPGRETLFEETRRRSLEEQERLEKSGESLEAYLARYLA